jgi:uncharacterized protein YbaA (DUF1428 family)
MRCTIIMSCVDTFVVPVPVKNLAACRRMSRVAGRLWREHGAHEFRERVADDVEVGMHASFPQRDELEAAEIAVFSWIAYKSRARRDRGNARVVQNPRFVPMIDPKSMPFDGKRKFRGGFEATAGTKAPDGIR